MSQAYISESIETKVCARRVDSTFTSNDDPVPMPGPTSVLVPGYRNQCLRLTSHNKEREESSHEPFSHINHPADSRVLYRRRVPTNCFSVYTQRLSIDRHTTSPYSEKRTIPVKPKPACSIVACNESSLKTAADLCGICSSCRYSTKTGCVCEQEIVAVACNLTIAAPCSFLSVPSHATFFEGNS
jgi:hypothetical protein